MTEVNEMQKQLIDSLFEHGVLIDLDFSVWTGQVQIKPEDIGLQSIPNDLMTLGRKRLVRKELSARPIAIHSSARVFIDKMSFPFPLSRARFIPYKKVETATRKLQEYKREFDSSVQEIVSEYEAEKKLMLGTWGLALEKHFAGRVDIDKALDRLLASYPDVEYIQRQYRFEWRYFDIQLPKNLSVKIADFNVHEEMERSIQEFVGNSVAVLRQRVGELAEHVKELVQNDGCRGFTSATIQSVEKTVNAIKTLNFFQDSVVDSEAERIKLLVTSRVVVKNNIENQIDVIINNLKQDIDKSAREAISRLTGDGKRVINV